MKASSLYIALGAAQLVACRPVSIVLREQSDVSDALSREFKHKNSADGIWPGPGSLPPLSKHQVPTAGSTRPGPGRIIYDPVAIQIDDIDVLELNNEFEPSGVPHRLERPTAESNDKLIVYLALAFLLVVVVMETGKTVFRRQGVIRLEDNPAEPPTSAQASSPPSVVIEDEKQRLPA
ncbi:hypothetical protein MFIFM68171_02014 [Madurella fahalii]|uniref:Uncharacterized protein n=1 Tax=Madurella fahalii TaxID=1157608 RepID=A0ABQ0G294_9PEZI